MKLKQLAATGLIVGMIAIAGTGCARNLPQTNQANRNGQRVADAVHHRPDTYRNTNIAERETRGVGETANRAVTRSTNPTARRTTPHTAPATPNTTNNRSLNLGRPQGRIGNAFRYNHQTGTAHGVHGTGERQEELIANTNTAVTPAAVAPSTTTPAVTSKRTEAKPAVTKPASETKRIDTVRTATPAKPVENRETTPVAPAAHVAPAVTRSAPARHVNTGAMVHTPNIKNPEIERHVEKMRAYNDQFKTNPNGRLIEQHIENARANRLEHDRLDNTNNRVAPRNTSNRLNTTHDRYGLNLHNSNRTIGMHPNMDHTVAVINNEDTAFFRRNNEVTPTVPTEPTTPAPTTTSYYDHDDNTYDEDSSDNVTPQNVAPVRNTQTAPQRVMK